MKRWVNLLKGSRERLIGYSSDSAVNLSKWFHQHYYEEMAREELVLIFLNEMLALSSSFKEQRSLQHEHKNLSSFLGNLKQRLSFDFFFQSQSLRYFESVAVAIDDVTSWAVKFSKITQPKGRPQMCSLIALPLSKCTSCHREILVEWVVMLHFHCLSHYRILSSCRH